MQVLKEKIINEGQAIGNEIVKVDGFLNHRIDVAFMEKLGKEFKTRFHDADINKVLTVESSGIIVAAMTAREFGNAPLVFAKKTAPSTMVDGFYGANVKSFTKGIVSTICVAKKYLDCDDRVLIIDDFLAHGEAALGLVNLVEQAGGKVVGIGAVIEKQFQGGSKRLRDKGYVVESLAVIAKIENGEIYFK
jgi:xanthine phosphoribosyltransferase